MSGHQFFKKKITNKQWVMIGTVDYDDPIKEKFYVNKMIGILESKDLLAKSRVVKAASHHHGYIEILTKAKSLNHYEGTAWVHPRGGGDDYSVRIKTQAENLTVAKKQVREHLLKKFHTNPNQVNDFTLKKVNKKK